MHRQFRSGALIALLVASVAPAHGEDAGSLLEAITGGQPVLSFRYRYEDVTDDAVGDRHARASTLRSVLGFRTQSWKSWSAYLEAENVAVIGNDLYNNAGAGDLDNGVRNRPVVADPASTEVQQAFLQWQRAGSTLQLGRREILLGDQRFVGNVGWRQNHQSFDAFTFTNSSLERADLFYGYVDNVNRIDGSNHRMGSHLANVGIDLAEKVKLTLYAYLLDYEDPAQFGLSTSTYGAEIAGRTPLDDSLALLWELEYAAQRDSGDNPSAVDASYLFGSLGVAFEPVTVKLGFEVLEGSAEDGQFRTPLATLHKFNGWADKFLSTPINGLEDLYLQLSGQTGPIDWALAYHDFSAESGGADYGEELDVQLLYTAPWKQTFALKGALYEANTFAEDTHKWMLFTTYKI